MKNGKKLVLADSLSEEGVRILNEAPGIVVQDLSGATREELKRALADSAGLIVRSATRADRELIESAGSLEVIGRAGVGLDNIDVDAATHRGVAVLNAPAGNTFSTAELAIGLLLAAARRIPEADRSVRGGEWDRSGLRGIQLAGRTLGVIGAGRIGREVIRRALAFGMQVLAHDPYLGADRAADLGVKFADLDALLEASDFVTLHVPLNDQTVRMLDARRISRMRRGAILVNAARGGLVDEEAVAEALREGRLGAAAFDVFEHEPLPRRHPLRDAPNVVLTPHIGASTGEAQREVAIEIAHAMRDALLEGDLRGAVNVTPVGAEERRRLEPVLDLARRLGILAAALAGPRTTRLDVRLASPAERGLRLVAAAAAMGYLRGTLAGPLNFVNALVVAEEHGVEIGRSRLPPVPGHPAWVEVAVAVEGGARVVAGAIREDRSACVVRLDGYPVNVSPRGTLLIVRNRDVPGVIGGLGTRLGEAEVNIGEFHQSRDARGGEALAVIGLDQPLPAGLAEELAALPDVLEVHEVRIDDDGRG